MKEVDVMEQLLSIPKEYLDIMLAVLDKYHDIDAIKEILGDFDKQCFVKYWSKYDVKCICNTDVGPSTFCTSLQSSMKIYIEEVIGECPNIRQYLTKKETVCCYMGIAWVMYKAPYLKPKFSRAKLLNLQYTISKWFVDGGYPVRLTEEKLYKLQSKDPFGIYKEIGYWRLFGEEYHDFSERDNRPTAPAN